MKTRLAPEDQDLLSRLDALNCRLYMLVHHATKYRTIIRLDLRLLRQGSEPAAIRAGLERWRGVLSEIKRLAREI